MLSSSEFATSKRSGLSMAARARATMVARRAAGIPRAPRSAARTCCGVGKAWVSAASPSASGFVESATSLAARPRAAATLICWPRMARMATSNASQPPGVRSPGWRRTMGASVRSREECGDGLGVGVEIEDAAQARCDDGQSRDMIAGDLDLKCITGGRVAGGDKGDVLVDRDDAAIDAVADIFNAGDGAWSEEGEQRVPVEWWAIGEAQDKRSGGEAVTERRRSWLGGRL